jgi:hypothetical protein
MTTKRTLFLPYIDPFVWIYLFLTGQFRYRVWCFQSAYVPQFLFKRIPIEQMDVETYMSVGSDAVNFFNRFPSQMDGGSHLKIRGHKIPIWMFNLKERARFVTNIFHTMKVLPTLGDGKSDGNSFFYLPCPIENKNSLRILTELFENRTGFVQRKSIFLEVIHPALLRLIAVQIVIFEFLRHWKIQEHQFGVATNPRILYLDVTGADAHPNPLEYLSSAFLIDDRVIHKGDIVFVVPEKTTRATWKRCGYNTVTSITKLAGRPKVVDIVKLFWGRHLNHFSFIYPGSFNDPLNILCSLKAIESGEVTSLLYSNSYFGSAPAAALPFVALSKPVTMMWYSASMYDGHAFAHLLADQIIVWNKLMERFLTAHTQHKGTSLKSVGALMFSNDECSVRRLSERKTDSKDYGPRIIGVYAVQPKPLDIIQAARIATNYDEVFYRQFMSDVGGLSTAFENVVVKSKAKRSTEIVGDLSMYDIQSEMANKNPYKSIAECKIVICMPFTSIYYAALQLGVPAIFYSPENKIFSSLDELQRLLIVGSDDLQTAVHNILNGLSEYPKLSSETRALLVQTPLQSTTRLARQLIANHHF